MFSSEMTKKHHDCSKKTSLVLIRQIRHYTSKPHMDRITPYSSCKMKHVVRFCRADMNY